jgi:hypothetical protein
MSAFHQIGHDSENLMFEEGLSRFGGAILSPLNYKPAEIAAQLEQLKYRQGFVTLFDPHLYRPQSERGCLPEWDYYPKDVETADVTPEWSARIVDQLAQTAIQLGPTSVASPAIVPRAFPDEFYLELVQNANRLQSRLVGSPVKAVQTAVVNLPDLASAARVMAIASIISQSHVEDCLLILVGSTDPRRELAEPEELKGAMKLIAALESAGERVTVGSCSSEMVLWKAAGATHCASGKFFNLRRFTMSRFDEPNGGGGGQLGYWFEESLLCFLRQSDLLRVQGKGLLSEASMSNPFSANILENIPQKKAWLALAWRHFLYWFADAEHRLATGAVTAEDLVGIADANWAALETSKPRLLMEERQNTGDWVRQWRRALEEYPYFV